MLTISKSSAGHAAHYYTADNPGQAHSVWLGLGAKDLGLAGQVDSELFKQVINGTTPQGERLYQRRLISRVDGYDLTLSAPKSVSLIAVWKGDDSVLRAHREAVSQTLKAIEKETQTRKMVSGKVQFITTGNLVAAAFEHTLNRHNDPQLHTHCIIINVTKHQNKWRSFYARKIFQKIKEWGKFYRDRLAEILTKIGHQIRSVGKGFWEIASVPKTIIRTFSRRRAEIIEAVGSDASTAQKQYACLSTRPSKETKKHTTLKRLRQRWDQIAKVSSLKKSMEKER
ncbi:MAG: MobF family relaxase [Cyanobacteria bacterium J06634_5]